MEKHVFRAFRQICGKGGALVLALTVFTAQFAAAQEEEAGLTLSVEFTGSLVSANSEGVVDSMADSGFDEDGTSIGLGYEAELWGAAASLKFGNETLRILIAEGADMIGGSPLSIDELYAWIRPFGRSFKFTGGIFEDTDGVADYADDLDDFDLGVFLLGEDGAAFTEPEANTNAALVSGFLAGATLGPLTLQLQLAPNFSKESGSELVDGFLDSIGQSASTPTSNTARLFRIGGRVIADLGFGSVSALFKTFQMPVNVVNLLQGASYPGDKQNYSTFGTYLDLTAIENLGLSLGYTGFLANTDADGTDGSFWSGIDLRAAWTGIEGLSISSHNNISFAKGSANDMMGLDGNFFSLYTAVGATKELTERFSLNAQIGNIFSNTDINGGQFKEDTFWVEPAFIAAVGEHAEFSAGVRLEVTKTFQSGSLGDVDDAVTTFSVPVGITISF